MPLINVFQSGGDVLYTTKQHVKLYDSAFVNTMIVSEQIKSGDGIFSGLGSLIISGVNFATANKDLIQAVCLFKGRGYVHGTKKGSTLRIL